MSYKDDILYILEGREYYLNSDGIIVSQEVDDTKGYRVMELAPEVTDQLNLAREQGRYPSKHMINALVSMQEISKTKAVNYVKYRLLGSASYLDVFGPEARRQFEAEQHYRQSKEIEDKIDLLQIHLHDIEILLFNLAKNSERRKAG